MFCTKDLQRTLVAGQRVKKRKSVLAQRMIVNRVATSWPKFPELEQQQTAHSTIPFPVLLTYQKHNVCYAERHVKQQLLKHYIGQDKPVTDSRSHRAGQGTIPFNHQSELLHHIYTKLMVKI